MRGRDTARKRQQQKMFEPTQFLNGLHIFCDGAAVPNPGAGGWGVVVYRDGVEIHAASGGDIDATNNQMELCALLNAILWAARSSREFSGPATIWSDSQYCVRGINEWLPNWKRKGWQRGTENQEPHNRVLLNVQLWQAIDEALGETLPASIVIRWVKGHAGVAGNERADQLAEQGRRIAIDDQDAIEDPLDAEFRQIMGAA